MSSCSGMGFNYYVVGQEEAALIECGTSAGAQIFAGQWAALEDKPDIKYIVVLHSHFDHVCGIPMLKRAVPRRSGSRQQHCAKGSFQREGHGKRILTAISICKSYLQAGFISEEPEAPACNTIPVDVVVGKATSCF